MSTSARCTVLSPRFSMVGYSSRLGTARAWQRFPIGSALFFGKVFPFASAEVVLYSHNILPGITWHFTRGSAVAVVCIVVLTVVNILGVKLAAILQNFASMLTLVAIGLMVSLGLAFGHGSWSHFQPLPPPLPFWPPLSAIGIAFVAIFWTYDGWNLISWVAGEIKNAERNLPRAMTWGVLLVSLTYVSANVVYVYALPMAQVAQQSTLAAAAVSVLSHLAYRGYWCHFPSRFRALERCPS